jgi:aminodeoxyfutalosine synthase
MPDGIAAFQLKDPALEPIAAKVLGGVRLDDADGVALYATADLLGLGRLADYANARLNGDRVLFSANQHINPTNVCILRNTCVFCSFARMPKEEGA